MIFVIRGIRAEYFLSPGVTYYGVDVIVSVGVNVGVTVPVVDATGVIDSEGVTEIDGVIDALSELVGVCVGNLLNTPFARPGMIWILSAMSVPSEPTVPIATIRWSTVISASVAF